MTVNLSPTPYQRFVDSNGNALSGGLLYTYAAGTTTPQATYTDSTGGTPNQNPIVLNTRGEASIWLDPTLSYKFVLQTSGGAGVWSQDYITAYVGTNYFQNAEVQIASAATTDLGSAASAFIQITGTTSITSFGVNYKGPKFIRFAGAVTLTYNASSLILPGGANITTAAGDTCIVVPKATSGTPDGWTVVAYQQANNQFPATLAAAGYQKLPSGTIIQWGSCTATSGTGTATFPTTFPVACRSVSLIDSNGSGWNSTNLSVWATTTLGASSFSVKMMNWNGAWAVGSGVCNYIAVGY